MQRDYWYTVARDAVDMDSAARVGKKAAQRTVDRLGSQKVSTGQVPVVFAAEVASGLVSHFLSAISGGSLYRQASFLQGLIRPDLGLIRPDLRVNLAGFKVNPAGFKG